MDLLSNEKPKPFNEELRVTDIGERLWPHLGAKARRLLNTGIRNSVIQFDRGADGKVYQLKPIWAQEPQDRPDQEYKREIHLFLSLSKVVTFEELPDEMPDEWIRRYALLIDKLADAGKLNYGVLGPPVIIPLAKLEGHERPWRMMFCLYAFSDFEKDELNAWLGNEAFIDEGGLGSEDWTNLPE